MARTELPNGVILPAEYSDDWYEDMTSNLTKLDDVIGSDSEKLNSNDVAFLRMSSAALTDGGTGNFSDLNSSNKLKTGDYVLDSGRKLYQVVSVDSTNETFTVGNSLFKITAESDLAPVAESGDYDDLDNKPDLNPYDQHIVNTDIHVTTADKNKWNNGVTQSYVFRYSGTAVVPNSTIAYSTIDNTDNIKAGDKILDVDGKLFEITAVDTTNQTVTVGTALIDLAQDSDVVHKSGNENINGDKTFGHGTLIVNNGIGSNVHGEIKLNGSRSGYIVADNASDGVFNNAGCGVSILLQDAGKPLHIGGYKVDSNGRVFVDNTNKNPVLSITSGLVQTSTLIPENDTGNSAFRILSQINYANGDTSKVLDVRFVQYDDANASSAIYSNDDGKTSLGATSRRWSKIYGAEYYYGSNNVEFSTKFVTTDTAQTISGQKLFDDINTVSSSSEIGVSGGNRSYKVLDKNKKTISSLEGGTFISGMAYSFWLVNNGSDVFNGVTLYQPSANLAQLRPYNSTLSMQLGASNRYFSDCYTSKINSLTPSSLGMPSGNIADQVDISGYFTNPLTNSYTASANGWIYLRLGDISSCQAIVYDSNNNRMWGQSTTGSVEQITIPILKGQTLTTQWATTSSVNVDTARFIPCQGNV